jgi:hypothetical protein
LGKHGGSIWREIRITVQKVQYVEFAPIAASIFALHSGVFGFVGRFADATFTRRPAPVMLVTERWAKR